MTDSLVARAGRPLLLWAGLAISVLFAYLAVRDVRWVEVSRALRTSNYRWLAPALLALALANVMRAARWRFLFERRTRPPLGPTLGAMLAGQFFNNILPARAGEVARIAFLRQRAGVSRAETTATVLLERAYDVLCLIVLLFVLAPWFPHVTWLRGAALLGAALTAALAAASVVLTRYEAPLRFVLRPLALLPFVPSERAERARSNFVHGLAGLQRLRLVAGALFWTTTSWLVLAVSFWLVMRGFDLGLSPVAGILVAVTTGLGMVIPSSPGAIGVFEATTLVALTAYGISPSRALSYALVLHAMNFVPYLVAGAVVLRRYASVRRR